MDNCQHSNGCFESFSPSGSWEGRKEVFETGTQEPSGIPASPPEGYYPPTRDQAIIILSHPRNALQMSESFDRNVISERLFAVIF